MTVYDFLQSYPSYLGLLVFDDFNNDLLDNTTVGELLSYEIGIKRAKHWQVVTHRTSCGILVIHVDT